MTRPTLSVVMPNYNHAKFLPRALDSLLGQTRPPDELLVLDDASTDNSIDVVERYAKRQPCLRLIRNSVNEGVNRANNRLFQLARGDYIHPAAADDDRFPAFFERAMGMVQDYPEAGLVFGKMVVENECNERLGTIQVHRWKSPLFASVDRFVDDYFEAELATHSATAATIYHREALLEAGGYRTELGSWADSFAFRAIGLHRGVVYVPEEFAIHRKMAGSFSERSKEDPRRLLDIAARAARLMRSDQFCDRFPTRQVRKWEQHFRRLTIWNDWLGSDLVSAGRRPSFLARNLRRLPRTMRALALAFYRGDVSCYDRGFNASESS